jgi:general secretion pathway protein D
VQGFAAVPAGNAIKIIPETNVRSDAGMLNGNGRGQPMDDVVTHVYTMQNISAAQLVPILRPLIPQWGHLAAYPGNNMLIISDRAGNVARLEEIIRKMDNVGDKDVDAIELQNASATEVVRILTSLIQAAKAADPSVSSANVIADERTNSVLITGERSERNRVAALVNRLDAQGRESDGATQVVYLRYASAKNLAPLLEGYAAQIKDGNKGAAGSAAAASSPAASGGGSGEAKVIADEDTNALVITAPPKPMRQIKSVIEQLDIQRSQVLLQAIIAEISEQKTSQLGLDFAVYNPDGGAISSILSSQTLSALSSFGTGGPLAALGTAIGQGITAGGVSVRNDGRSGTSFGVILRALQTDGDTNVLSTPSLVSLDNEESEVKVGQEVPFQTGSFTNTGGTNGSVNPFQTIERKDVGLTLGFTPQVNEGDTIKLKIKLESSNVAAGAAGAANLVTNKRTITNTVSVESGQVLVIGGLMDDNVADSQSGVPYLSNLPVLGNLFKNRSVTKSKRNLVVFIHPTILRSRDHGDFFTRKKYDSIRTAQIRANGSAAPLVGGKTAALPELERYLLENSLPPQTPQVLAPRPQAAAPQSESMPPARPAAPEPEPMPAPAPRAAAPPPATNGSAVQRRVASNVLVIPAQQPQIVTPSSQ